MVVPKSIQTRVRVIEINQVPRSSLLFPHPFIKIGTNQMQRLSLLSVFIFFFVFQCHDAINAPQQGAAQEITVYKIATRPAKYYVNYECQFQELIKYFISTCSDSEVVTLSGCSFPLCIHQLSHLTVFFFFFFFLSMS